MFVFPEQRYACLQCGKSCGHWRIWVEPELVEPLKRHPLALALQVAGQQYLESQPGEMDRLAYDQEGRCFFLQDGRLCGLHASTGWLSKPRACRQFPFFLVETPDGCQIGLSFRCTAVQQNHGRDWSEHHSDLSQLRASGRYPKVGFEPARLGRRQLTWSDYLEWEKEWCAGVRAGKSLAACVYSRLQPFLELMLDPGSFHSLLEECTFTAIAWLEGDLSLTAALRENGSYLSPRRGPVEALAAPFCPLTEENNPQARYLCHVLERKQLWMGPDFLGKLMLVLVSERLLQYYRQSLGDWGPAFDLVEGEWLAHQDDLGPLERQLAATLLQFAS